MKKTIQSQSFTIKTKLGKPGQKGWPISPERAAAILAAQDVPGTFCRRNGSYKAFKWGPEPRPDWVEDAIKSGIVKVISKNQFNVYAKNGDKHGGTDLWLIQNHDKFFIYGDAYFKRNFIRIALDE